MHTEYVIRSYTDLPWPGPTNWFTCAESVAGLEAVGPVRWYGVDSKILYHNLDSLRRLRAAVHVIHSASQVGAHLRTYQIFRRL